MIHQIQQYIYQLYLQKKYNIIFGKNCMLNRHNYFEGYNKFYNETKISNSFIGLGTYISSYSYIRNTKIGRFCSIGQNVKTYLGKHPVKEMISIHPAFFSTKKQAGFTFVNNDLFEEHIYIDADKKFVSQIGNDVWIGNNVLIFDGVKIGNGAVIGAGSVVTKDIEPYSIAYGVPCKIQKYRFDPDTIRILEEFSWWNKDLDWIKQNASRFNNVEGFTQFICSGIKNRKID